jgi:beta-glucanase (GH16 family)
MSFAFAAAVAASSLSDQDATLALKEGKTMVFAQEFDKPGAPDPSIWIPEVGKIRNNEMQTYTKERSKNARIEGGRLVIEAHKEEFEGASVTSASLTTAKSFTYGFFEIKARFPTGKGTWPAIWMLGESIRKPEGQGRVDWPACGEIDIMENVGFNPESIHFTVHNAAHNHAAGTALGGAVSIPKAWESFHTYGLDWRKDRLDFYFNGAKVFTYNKPADPKGWPYDEPHYLILNLAIGGAWGGAQGVDDSIFPSRFEVEHVRIYQ